MQRRNCEFSVYIIFIPIVISNKTDKHAKLSSLASIIRVSREAPRHSQQYCRPTQPNGVHSCRGDGNHHLRLAVACADGEAQRSQEGVVGVAPRGGEAQVDLHPGQRGGFVAHQIQVSVLRLGQRVLAGALGRRAGLPRRATGGTEERVSVLERLASVRVEVVLSGGEVQRGVDVCAVGGAAALQQACAGDRCAVQQTHLDRLANVLVEKFAR